MTLPYIFDVALMLACCIVFYKLFLRRETFYRMNRYVLIACVITSFALPLLHVPQQFSLRKPAKSAAIIEKHPQPIAPQQPASTATASKETRSTASHNGTRTPQTTTTLPVMSGFSFEKALIWLVWLYWFGVIVFGVRFLFQVALLTYRNFRSPVIMDGKFRIVEVSGDKAPCSFGNVIFINPEKYDWETYSQILLHEKIHVQERHSLDILLAELVLIFQWFNPFAWLCRREIESNLEFLTDDSLVNERSVDKRSYQLSLVRVSAPHFPLSLTTNYNQSILKNRIAMMNSKRSSLHTMWKYFFLLPMFAILACLLNEPAARGQDGDSHHRITGHHNEMATEGAWFATLKGDKVSMQMKNDDDSDMENGFNTNTFKASDFTPSPKEGVTSFQLARDAGTVQFTGRFEGTTGMGHYKFTSDKGFKESLGKDLDESLNESDMIVMFFVNVKKDYVPMLKKEGFAKISKDEVIPLAALNVDQQFIHAIRNAGFKDLTPENLVTFKALSIDEKYVNEIREAGYKNISSDQIVSFKAQGIDKNYIEKMRKASDKTKANSDPDDLVSFKAMDISEEFINSFKAVGITGLDNSDWVSFKAVGVTPEYVKSWQAAGFRNLEPEDYVGMKSQNLTPDDLKSFAAVGYKELKPEQLVSWKATGITPEFIRSFTQAGYRDIDAEQFPALKSLHITPEFIRSFEDLGFKDIPIEQIISVKAVGVTPEYIKEMKSKGFNYQSIEKYVTLKSIDDRP